MAFLVYKYNNITESTCIVGVALSIEKAEGVIAKLNDEITSDGRRFYKAWYEEISILGGSEMESLDILKG